ncbi:thioesterase domain-containing protein [Nocardia sp. NRRL S-836]|uniref:thioesterase domain-containing protein n=1 Tax=Nocardia sp. NRRL S-836 TaxID=1519492 RepID=UPI0006B0059F|nr:thioesterase domain-containing protein [Nocardia sp. NRRL S-836]KOV81374.1 thioesterase [Nocardia sp. NRRL S-836]
MLGRLITLVRRGDRPSAVLLPGAGGGLNPYLRLATHLGARYNVHAVRAAGLVPDEEPERTIAEMADSARHALAEAGVEPELVFGWSLGGTIGWELCQRLPGAPDLVLVDSSPLPRVSTVEDDTELREFIVGMLGPRPDPATADRVRATFDTQVAALADYRGTGSYAGRVLMLMCLDDDFRDREAAADRWCELAPDLVTGTLAASHYSVFDPEHLPELTAQLDAFLGVRA